MNDSTRPPGRRGWLRRWALALLGLIDRWLHLSCRAFVQIASAKYDRPLTRWERVSHASHRAMCRVCRVQERRMDQLHALVQEIVREDLALVERPSAPVDIRLSDEARGRIRRALGQVPVSGASPSNASGAAGTPGRRQGAGGTGSEEADEEQV